jgi:acyl-coenzyme A synthetase/AMP-(fatty) acid ligase
VITSGRGTDYFVDMVAVWAMGAVVIPLDPNIDARRLATICEKSEPEVVLGQLALAAEFQLNQLEQLRSLQTPSQPFVEDIAADDDAAIFFTSGSTGAPKGVRLAHCAVLGNSLSTIKNIGITETDRLFISIPFHFTSAICHFLAATLSGATLIATEQKLFQHDLFKALIDENATAFGGAPIQLRWIGECATEEDINLNWLMSSGDRLSVDIIEQLQQQLPRTKVFTVYGLTEVGGRLCILPDSELATNKGSVGYPLDGMRITVRDDNGQELPTGEIGEVYVDGPFLFSEYINDAEKTHAAKTSLGFHTGDEGFLNENGALCIRGRTDDVFKVSGQKVSAVMIQDALMSLGHFQDVAVAPGEDPMTGTVPFAYFVAKPEFEFKKGIVLRGLRKILPVNHLPQKFIELEHIPRTGSGKLDRVAFRNIITNTTGI